MAKIISFGKLSEGTEPEFDPKNQKTWKIAPQTLPIHLFLCGVCFLLCFFPFFFFLGGVVRRICLTFCATSANRSTT